MHLRGFALLRNTYLTISSHSEKFPPPQVNPIGGNVHYNSTAAEP